MSSPNRTPDRIPVIIKKPQSVVLPSYIRKKSNEEIDAEQEQERRRCESILQRAREQEAVDILNSTLNQLRMMQAIGIKDPSIQMAIKQVQSEFKANQNLDSNFKAAISGIRRQGDAVRSSSLSKRHNAKSLRSRAAGLRAVKYRKGANPKVNRAKKRRDFALSGGSRKTKKSYESMRDKHTLRLKSAKDELALAKTIEEKKAARKKISEAERYLARAEQGLAYFAKPVDERAKLAAKAIAGSDKKSDRINDVFKRAIEMVANRHVSKDSFKQAQQIISLSGFLEDPIFFGKQVNGELAVDNAKVVAASDIFADELERSGIDGIANVMQILNDKVGGLHHGKNLLTHDVIRPPDRKSLGRENALLAARHLLYASGRGPDSFPFLLIEHEQGTDKHYHLLASSISVHGHTWQSDDHHVSSILARIQFEASGGTVDRLNAAEARHSAVAAKSFDKLLNDELRATIVHPDGATQVLNLLDPDYWKGFSDPPPSEGACAIFIAKPGVRFMREGSTETIGDITKLLPHVAGHGVGPASYK